MSQPKSSDVVKGFAVLVEAILDQTLDNVRNLQVPYEINNKALYCKFKTRMMIREAQHKIRDLANSVVDTETITIEREKV